MCSPFSCGSFKNLKEYDIEDDELVRTPCKTPKTRSKSCRSYSSKKRRDGKKNPYANQGLEKFSALLARLEEKKQKIYTQKGSEDISVIYFTYTKSDDFEPFIVKVKNKEKTNIADQKDKKEKETKGVSEIKATPEHEAQVQAQQPKEKRMNQRVGKPFWSIELRNPRHIFGYLPATIVMILVLLAVYGRSFAILCTTVAWYLAPLFSSKIAQSPMKKNKINS